MKKLDLEELNQHLDYWDYLETGVRDRARSIFSYLDKLGNIRHPDVTEVRKAHKLYIIWADKEGSYENQSLFTTVKEYETVTWEVELETWDDRHSDTGDCECEFVYIEDCKVEELPQEILEFLTF